MKSLADTFAGSQFPVVRDALAEIAAGRVPPSNTVDLVAAQMRQIHPDVVLDLRELEVMDIIYPSRVARGFRQWAEFWSAWFEAWEALESQDEWEDVEPGVVLQEVRLELSGRSSGAKISMHQWHRFEVYEGKLMRLSCHQSREAALAGPGPVSR